MPRHPLLGESTRECPPGQLELTPTVQIRQRLGPDKRHPFPIREVRSLVPYGQEINPAQRHAGLVRPIQMQLQTVGAAVDLRGARFHQISQSRMHVLCRNSTHRAKRCRRLRQALGGGIEIDELRDCHSQGMIIIWRKVTRQERRGMA